MKVDQLPPKDIANKAMEGFKKQIAGKIDIVKTEVLTENKKRIPVEISGTLIKIKDKVQIIGIFRVIGKR